MRIYVSHGARRPDKGGGLAVRFITSDVYKRAGYPANHPLAIARLAPVMALCEHLGWLDGEAVIDSPQASRDELAAFHDPAYLDALWTAEATGSVTPAQRLRHNIGTMENPVFPGLFRRASLTVGGSVLAARHASQGEIAYHPAGGTHHGQPDRASGFCYFNDPVFAIRTLLDLGKARVLYVDLDAHHGDGVEAAFSGDQKVRLISVHEENRWPGSGRLTDRGGGNASNLPVPAGMNDSEFGFLMARAVLPLAQDFAPEAVVITCGADALAGDPLSSLALSNGCLMDAVLALTAVAPGAVVLGGGGYNPWTVARLWAGLWGRLAGHAPPQTLPEPARACLAALTCDLVDDEDFRPEWLESLLDPPNPGPIRQGFHDIAASVLADARLAAA